MRSEIGAGEESLHECYNVIYIYLSVLVCVKEWGFLNDSIDPSRIAYGCQVVLVGSLVNISSDAIESVADVMTLRSIYF